MAAPDPSASVAPWWANYALAFAVLAVFAGALLGTMAIGNDTERTTMITAAIALAMTAVGYFYKSSAGSAQKDQNSAAANAQAIDALATSAPASPPQPPAPPPAPAPDSSPAAPLAPGAGEPSPDAEIEELRPR